jgi:predicted transcriptional regulator
METRITFRASDQTLERLRALAEKYGVSQSALLSMFVHERWLAEQPKEVREDRVDLERYEPKELEDQAIQMGIPEEVVKKPVGKVGSAGLVRFGARKRHKSK